MRNKAEDIIARESKRTFLKLLLSDAAVGLPQHLNGLTPIRKEAVPARLVHRILYEGDSKKFAKQMYNQLIGHVIRHLMRSRRIALQQLTLQSQPGADNADSKNNFQNTEPYLFACGPVRKMSRLLKGSSSAKADLCLE